MRIKQDNNKNFTTSYAGLAIYKKLWNKFELSKLFDDAVLKHSGSSFSAIMQNLFSLHVLCGGRCTH